MTTLAVLLIIDAVLHAAVIYRFGTSDKANMPFLIFAIVDVVLAALVYFDVSYSLWITLVLSLLGLIGLTLTFNKPQHEKTLDRAIWIIDLGVVLYSAYLLYL